MIDIYLNLIGIYINEFTYIKKNKRKPVNVLHSGENCYILTEMYNM